MGGSFCPATALLLMDKNWDIPVLCNYFSLHGPRSPQSRIITRVSSLQPEELPSPAMVQGKRTALLLWLGTLVLTCIISEKSPLLIFCILGIDKPSAGAGGVSSHRVLLKKGAIWPGHPMSSHGVLGEKRVLSVRGTSPPCPSCPHLPLTLETSSSTHGTNAAFLINWAMWLKPNINIKMEFSARNYVQFLLQKANYILQLFLLLPSYKCLQEVVQSKVSQSKSWQQLRAVRSKVNALHFSFVGGVLSYRNFELPYVMNIKPNRLNKIIYNCKSNQMPPLKARSELRKQTGEDFNHFFSFVDP